jgi:hypothetical protein
MRTFLLLLVAAALEVGGDALICSGLKGHAHRTKYVANPFGMFSRVVGYRLAVLSRLRSLTFQRSPEYLIVRSHGAG